MGKRKINLVLRGQTYHPDWCPKSTGRKFGRYTVDFRNNSNCFVKLYEAFKKKYDVSLIVSTYEETPKEVLEEFVDATNATVLTLPFADSTQWSTYINYLESEISNEAWHSVVIRSDFWLSPLCIHTLANCDYRNPAAVKVMFPWIYLGNLEIYPDFMQAFNPWLGRNRPGINLLKVLKQLQSNDREICEINKKENKTLSYTTLHRLYKWFHVAPVVGEEAILNYRGVASPYRTLRNGNKRNGPPWILNPFAVKCRDSCNPYFYTGWQL